VDFKELKKIEARGYKKKVVEKEFENVSLKMRKRWKRWRNQ
jgi:hypothetical protein